MQHKNCLETSWQKEGEGTLNTAKNIAEHRITAKKGDGTPSPQYIVLVWWYKGLHVIILFKITSRKSPKQTLHNAKSVVTLLMPLDRFCLNFATERSMKVTAKLHRKVTAASPVQERFWEGTCPKIMETGIPQIISFHHTPQTLKCKHRTS